MTTPTPLSWQEILEKNINEKKIALHLKANGGMEEKENSNAKEQALSNDQILELAEMIKNTEAYYGFPIDTEWAFEGNKLYLLQARPITTHIPLFPELITILHTPIRENLGSRPARRPALGVYGYRILGDMGMRCFDVHRQRGDVSA